MPPLADEPRAVLDEWRKRREQALSHRRGYEPIWRMCQSFLAGRQWVGWNERTNRVVNEPNPRERERHTANMITRYHQTVLGKLYVEDLRPDIIFTREDVEAMGVAKHAQAVSKYLWDSEVNGDERMFGVLHKMLTFGTSALRCWFDPDKGAEIGDIPIGPDGQPMLDPMEAHAYMSEAYPQVQMELLREGKITWEALGPDNILPPPGVEDPELFQWLIVERPLPIELVELRYPHVGDRLRGHELETADIIGQRELPSTAGDMPAGGSQRIRGHVMVSTGYESPTREHRNGRVVVFSDQELLEERNELPYRLRGEPHHGVFFFHYHRVDNRFWGKGVVEDLIGPQRQLNRARSQMIELKDRNLGRVYARKGTFNPMNQPKGKVMEVIEIPLHAEYPQEVAGGGIGPWIQNEAEINKMDMDLIAGLNEVSFGGSPPGVSAYAAMALLAEQDERRIGPAMKRIRHGIGDAVLLSLNLARQYWPENKEMAVAGPDSQIEVFLFTRAMLPNEFYLDVSKFAPLPTSPSAESQKIFDLYHAGIAGGEPLGVGWLYESLQAGKALPVPRREEQVQIGKAELENFMMQGGQALLPAYYDDDYIHIQVHRQAQSEVSMVPGQEMWTMALEQHILMHTQNAATKKPTAADAVPSAQGGHGIEAQNGAGVNMQGLAQQPEKGPTNVGGTPNSGSSQSA